MIGGRIGRPIRVLRLAPAVPPVPGGMEQHIRRLTDEQRERGWKIELLFCAGDSIHGDDSCLSFGSAVRRMRPQSFRALGFILLAVPTLFRRVGKIDVVHVHGDWSMALAGRLAKWVLRADLLVVSVHGGPGASNIRAVLQRLAFGMADLVHATGRRDAERIQGHVSCPVLWQPSGVHDDFLGAGLGRGPADLMRTGRATVVTTAVLRPMKNIDLLLEISALLPEIDFVVIGSGPELQRLEAKRVAMGLANVRFEGMRPRQEVRASLDVADLFLCTSFVEGTPTSVLEAMCRGLPVVTSDCSDFRGIVDELNGRVASDLIPEIFAELIRQVLDDRLRWASMSKTSVERAKGLAWTPVAERISTSIRDVLNQRHGS